MLVAGFLTPWPYNYWRRTGSLPLGDVSCRTETLGNEITEWILDYANSNGITTLVVGVSGGIDSAVTSTLCAKTGLNTLALNMPIHQIESAIRSFESAFVMADKKLGQC